METLVWPVIAAMIYSLSFYLKKKKEGYEFPKLIATGLMGLIIGVLAVAGGVTEITEQFIGVQLGFYVGAIALLEAWIKILGRKLGWFVEE